jgi:hypothetical protein
MLLTLPGIVILAALLYLVASNSGWLDSVARWSRRPRSPRGRGPGPTAPPKGREAPDASSRRLEVFEEFLRNLGRDDSQDS